KLLSNVHRRTAFEKRALSLLTEHMSISLTRVEGSNDGGIDLTGWWWVPGGEKPTMTCACPVLSAPPPKASPSRNSGHMPSHVLPASQKSVESGAWPTGEDYA
ncbi:hypothetical protein EDB92DRAFT_1838082, partial [Lactarius akahatsu]